VERLRRFPACALAAVPPILYVIAIIKFCQGLLKVNEPPINVDGGLVYERERGAPVKRQLLR